MSIKRYFRLCGLLLKLRLNRQMVYSFNFWAAFFVDISVFLIQLAVFSSIFLQVDSMNGWNRYQMIFFVGTFTILDSLYMCIYFFGMLSIPDKVRTGKLDIYITKPVNTLFLISFESIDPGSVLVAVPGIMMVAYGAGKLGIAAGFSNIAGYSVLLLLMLVLMYDLMLIIRVASFWFIRIDSLAEFEVEMANFSFRIPGVVFRGISKLVFYILLPYGLMATIPTQFFTGVLDSRGWLMTIAVCSIFTVLSQTLWRKGLKRYESASS